MEITVILPVKNNSGGHAEVQRLRETFEAGLVQSSNYYLWDRDHDKCLVVAAIRVPLLLLEFAHYFLKRDKRKTVFILTHFSTYLLFPLLKTFNFKVACFIQAEEWRFYSSRIISLFLKKCIRAVMVRSHSNIFTSAALRSSVGLNLNIRFQDNNTLIHPIINDESLYSPLSASNINSSTLQSKKYSLFVLLRNGYVKNLSFYLQVLEKLSKRQSFTSMAERLPIRIVNMTDLADLDRIFTGLTFVASGPLTRTKFQEELSLSYASLYLSKYEGFGLVPFESILNSCLPVTLDCGGVTGYLPKNYDFLLNSNSSPEAVCEYVIAAVLSCDQFKLDTLNCLNENLRKYIRLAINEKDLFTIKFTNTLFAGNS